MAIKLDPASLSPRPGLQRIALCVVGSIAIGGLAAPRLAAAKGAMGGAISRAEVISRAGYWYKHRSSISYSQGASDTYRDPDKANHAYRRDCSGFISMALHLKDSLSTVTLPGVGTKISRKAMKAGDFTGILGNGTAGDDGHVRVFHKWVDKTAGTYLAYDFGSFPVKHQTYKLGTDKPRNGIGWTAYRYKKIK